MKLNQRLGTVVYNLCLTLFSFVFKLVAKLETRAFSLLGVLFSAWVSSQKNRLFVKCLRFSFFSFCLVVI